MRAEHAVDHFTAGDKRWVLRWTDASHATHEERYSDRRRAEARFRSLLMGAATCPKSLTLSERVGGRDEVRSTFTPAYRAPSPSAEVRRRRGNEIAAALGTSATVRRARAAAIARRMGWA